MKLLSYIAVLIMVSLALTADYLLKIAGTKQNFFNKFFISGALIYASTAFIWYFILKNFKFSQANLLYSLFTILFAVLIGIFSFKEVLKPIEILAIVMAFSSILILSRFS